jgi:signal transduction histidine kinase
VPFLNSLESKLITTAIVIVVVVLALAGAVFVVARRGDQRRQELDHITANATAIQREFILRQEVRGDSISDLAQFVDGAALAYDVRALMVDSSGQVFADSAGELEGARIAFEGSTMSKVVVSGDSTAYVTWRPAEGSPGSGLVLLGTPDLPLPAPGFQEFTFAQPRYSLLLAVSEDTLASAWLELLPEMGLAAAIAMPVAILLAVLIARYITRPLDQLTAASHEMASGNFDVRVPAGRQDEIGRLAQAFSTMAERVGEAQGQMRALVANVSHDMKTPLTSVLGFSQALRDDTATETETRRMAAIIHEEAERLNARLNDLLYLAELESGQVVLREDDVEVSEIVERTVARIAPDVERRGIEMSLEPPGQAIIRTDGQKLERAIENLLDNARKFTPDGGRIAVRGAMADGALSIEIANTVEGLEWDEVPRLFERFYHREPGADGIPREQAGSGLGLPIARDLAEILGGGLTPSLRNGDLVMRITVPSRRVNRLSEEADSNVDDHGEKDAHENTRDHREEERETVALERDVGGKAAHKRDSGESENGYANDRDT